MLFGPRGVWYWVAMVLKDPTVAQVQELLTRHAGGWADRDICRLDSTGTDNALFLLGKDAVLRIPIRATAVEPLEKELSWLPQFKGLPLSVPEVLFHGRTRREIGFDFGIFGWQEGQIATPDRIADPNAAARTLARFLSAMHKVNADGAPAAGRKNHNRGIKLAALTEKTLECLNVLSDEINAGKACEMWERACAAPVEDEPVWVHGDLKADNMIAKDGSLSAIIDWGLSAVGDPAVDYAAAWSWVEPKCRDVFQSECTASDAGWERARGWALYGAVIALSHYRGRSHEALCRQSRLTLRRLEL
ncbi:aminoglycoside phosphotransferase family protein [Hoeflea sp.]|uniref:aminoglycoside phosphotransferase family protein n=1 Tax=Hoeflea sp. TaxID=1940281 RepID=UPI003B02CB39